ncbi:MAG TPA: UDP-glucose/GDP-mannose dehydrogenase family protein [Anaerovoracaceae bacterium]|nr:UDP-glucose/GDP-mannose dehydrogenase family protein [Anaerovoracaceae bacterium]
MIKIGIVGTGYVGLVTGVCLSDFGWQVICADRNEDVINQLQEGKATIYEPGLEDLLARNTYYKRIRFTADIDQVVDECDVIFIAVGTPQNPDGSADLTAVYEVVRQIGRVMESYKIIVDKSTVPVGTGRRVKEIIREELERRNLEIDFDIVSNPEFLRQGSAIQDFTHADRVVIGAESQHAVDVMKEVYRVLYINETPFLTVNLETAEMVKYASNAFLAAKISFVNELSELCEKTGANIQQVAKGMGMDGRIGSKFLHAGPGYGGSCFPKDTKALVNLGENCRCELGIVKATIQANEKQKLRLAEKIKAEIGRLEGKKLGVLGLSFKNNTDDMREAPALTILKELSAYGACFRVYDPKAMKKAADCFLELGIESVKFCDDEYDASEEADAMLLLTEWNQFRSLDLDRIRSGMAGDCFFDFRNIYNREAMEEKGFRYFSVGRG